VGRCDLAQVARGVARHAGLAVPRLAGQVREAADEGGTTQDVLLDQSRHLVARAPHAPLGPLERESGLARHELRQTRGLAQIDTAGAAPALAQLGCGGGLPRHDAAAVRIVTQDPLLAQGPGVPWVAQAQHVAEVRGALAVVLAGQPDDAQGRQQHVGFGGEARLETGERHRAAPSGGRNPQAIPLRGVVARSSAFDPALEQALLETARGIHQEDDAAPVR
jgi:hypothetical protein